MTTSSSEPIETFPGSSPTDAGRAYFFSGASGALLFTLVSPRQKFGGFFGFAVSGMEDINGDRRGDLLVGASFDCDGRAGRSYLFSGGSGAPGGVALRSRCYSFVRPDKAR
ncbi:hypothetical protein BH18VER2_BH18VER2_14600 [soil metagenome]